MSNQVEDYVHDQICCGPSSKFKNKIQDVEDQIYNQVGNKPRNYIWGQVLVATHIMVQMEVRNRVGRKLELENEKNIK